MTRSYCSNHSLYTFCSSSLSFIFCFLSSSLIAFIEPSVVAVPIVVTALEKSNSLSVVKPGIANSETPSIASPKNFCEPPSLPNFFLKASFSIASNSSKALPFALSLPPKSSVISSSVLKEPYLVAMSASNKSALLAEGSKLFDIRVLSSSNS